MRNLFDTDRFWKVDSDKLAFKINENRHGSDENPLNKYINIAATDTKEQSCSIFVRKCNDATVKQYEVSVRDWYMNVGEDMPDYLVGYEDTMIKDFFAEIYVFRGEFTDNLKNGALSAYFDAKSGALKTNYKNSILIHLHP